MATYQVSLMIMMMMMMKMLRGRHVDIAIYKYGPIDASTWAKAMRTRRLLFG